MLLCPVALCLIDYWAQCPPTHMMLKYIGETLGVKIGYEKPQLSEAEKWAEAGIVPGVGPVKTLEYQSLPITVRVMIAQLEKEGKLHA